MLEGLVDGENVLTFSVKTRRGGISTLTCMLYLWEPECKIVISDVDGTITRSDVMGQVSDSFFFPLFPTFFSTFIFSLVLHHC